MSDDNKTHLRRQIFREEPLHVWCGFRVVLLLGLVAAVAVYVVGAIMTGIAFHVWNYDVLCDVEDGERKKDMFHIVVPMDVVGPCMMSFGSGIFLLIFIEWFFIKPFPTYMVM